VAVELVVFEDEEDEKKLVEQQRMTVDNKDAFTS